MPAVKRARSFAQRNTKGKKKFRRYGPSKSAGPKQYIANINNTPIRYSREFSFPNLVILATNTAVYNSYYFTISQLPNYAEFTPLFDQYRIRTIVMKFRLIAPPEANNTTLTQQYYPDIAVTVDHDDNATVTAIETIWQYGKCKRGILRPNEWFVYKCHPTAALQLYRTAATTAYAPAKNTMWMDLAQNDMPYYGVKTAIDASSIGGGQTANLSIEVHCVMTCEFKSVR